MRKVDVAGVREASWPHSLVIRALWDPNHFPFSNLSFRSFGFKV